MMDHGLVQRTIQRYVLPSDADWEIILPCWEERAFGKGTMISAAGEVEEWFSIVQHGVQRLYFEHDGEEHCLGFSYGGSWTGDYDSFISRKPGRFQVQAITDSVLCSILHADLQRLYDSVPVMERFGRSILEELIVGRATREIEQLSLSAEQRYRRLIDRSPHLLQLVPQKDIASYLRMSPETFSRLRARVR